MWAFPILCRVSARMGRTSSFCPVTAVKEVTATDEVVVEQVDTTPEAMGTAKTGSGITGTIWHYPGEAIYKYGVIFPQGYTIWNKPKEFRTYDDAEWYITEVISPAKDVTPEEKKVPVLAGATYKGIVEAEDGMKWWVYKNNTRDTWYIYDPMGEKKNKIFSSYDAYRTFMFPEMMAARAEVAASTEYSTGLLTNGSTITQPTIPGQPSQAQSGTRAQFMGLGILRGRIY